MKPSLFQFVQMSQDSDDEDEHFEDVPDDDDDDDDVSGDGVRNNKESKPGVGVARSFVTPSWVHKKNIQG